MNRQSIAIRLMGLLLLLGYCNLVNGQSKNVAFTQQRWLQYYTVSRLPQMWTFSADAGFRWKNGFSDPVQYIVRAGFGRDVTDQLNIGAGYTNSGFYSADTLSRWEHRPYQEIIFRNSSGNWSISQRLRAEERFFRILADDSESFNLRIRYSWMCSIPLTNGSEAHPNRQVLLNLGDEIFVNAGRTIVYNVFDQNRFILGLGFQMNKYLVINANLNHQFVALPSPGTYRQDYVLWIAGRHLFDFRHKS